MFFFGGLGVHNFYLGYTGKGVAQLSLFIFSIATAIIAIGVFTGAILGIWVFIEFILPCFKAGPYKTDSRGIPLS